MSTDVYVPTDGLGIATSWGAAVANRTAVGYLPYADSVPAGSASASSTTLPAVSGGLGGAILIPIAVDAVLYIQSVTIRQGSTASQRSFEFALYRDTGSTTLERITGTDGSSTFTPSAIDDRTANVSTPGTLVEPGIVYLVVRCTHATNDLLVRRLVPTELAGNRSMTNISTKEAALGSTITIGASWSGAANAHFARLNGRVMGGSSAF